MNNHYNLTQGIINLSNANTWDQAKLEWLLESVYKEDEPDTCLCGHYPIIEICILRNKLNEKSTVVGNCCVKKFIGLPSNNIFQAVKRVRKDIEKSFNPETISYARNKCWISEWDNNFYLDIYRKRNLSEKQESKKKQINMKILKGIVNARKSS